MTIHYRDGISDGLTLVSNLRVELSELLLSLLSTLNKSVYVLIDIQPSHYQIQYQISHVRTLFQVVGTSLHLDSIAPRLLKIISLSPINRNFRLITRIPRNCITTERKCNYNAIIEYPVSVPSSIIYQITTKYFLLPKHLKKNIPFGSIASLHLQIRCLNFN